MHTYRRGGGGSTFPSAEKMNRAGGENIERKVENEAKI